MKLYLDIYIAVNFTIDFFLLCLTGRVMKMSARIPRLIGAAALGTAFAVMSILLPLQGHALALAFALFTPISMLYTAFGKMSLSRLFQSYVILFGSSFAAGGIFSALSQHFPIMRQPRAMFAASFAVFFFCFFFFDIFSFSSDIEVVDIIVGYKNHEKKLRLLCDSGCLVREPIGGLPVILLSPKTFDSIYPPEECDTPEAAVRLGKRLVPMKTASGSAVISAVMPEKLYIESKLRVKKEKNSNIGKNENCLQQKQNHLRFRTNKRAAQSNLSSCRAMIGRSNAESFCGLDGIFPKSLLR